ncbi:3-hydroxyacyl-CoA dehydrogenase NAD-binding domain-containing protein [Micrococcaceae bacterium Sec5.7]
MYEETITNVATDTVVRDDFRIAILTLDNKDPRRPVTLGPRSLGNLAEALKALNPKDFDAVAVTGAGPVFCAGADLKYMDQLTTVEAAASFASAGQETLRLLASIPIPTFAFMNGSALGGGLELALHANYRTVASSATLGLPEVRLGLIPGWNGIPLVTALIGPTAAARLIVTDPLSDRTLDPEKAGQLGVVDAVLPEDDFLEESLAFATDILKHQSQRSRTARHLTAAAELDAIRQQLDNRFRGAAPAPYKALDLIACAASTPPAQFDDDAVARIFGELLVGTESRASRYAFHLCQVKVKRRQTQAAATETKSFQSVGVLGAGLMASQLALIFARQLRVPVLMTDLSADRISAAMHWIDEELKKQVKRRQLTCADAHVVRSLVTGTIDKADFSGCDVVIEAVFEELTVKRTVFAEVEPHLSEDAILLTNTSSLSVQDISAALLNPGQLIGFHFFNPVDVLQLIELVPSQETSDSTLAKAQKLASLLGKVPVVVKDTPGFVVNRILTRLFSEVLMHIDRGADPATVDHALDPLGLPMTPLNLLQFIGPRVQHHICQTLHGAYPSRDHSSSSLNSIVALNLPGYLTDQGTISPEAAASLPSPSPVEPEEIRAELLSALEEEIRIMLSEQVTESREDIDLCMILGANFPYHTGGLTWAGELT